MNDDAWLGPYFAGAFLPEPAPTPTGEADPVLVVGTVLETLAARGVPVVLDGTLDKAVEAAERLLRCLGVESRDPWTVASWTS